MKHVLSAIAALSVGIFAFPIAGHAKGGDTMIQAGDPQPHRQQSVASVVDGDGNVIVTGFRNLANDTNDDFWTVKLAPDGSILWRKSYDRNGGSDRAAAVVTDANNDVIVTGYSWNGSDNDLHTIKYSGSDGSVIWEHTYSGVTGGNDTGSSLAYDSSANLVYVGGAVQNADGNLDFLVLKYDNSVSGPTNTPNGVFTWGGAAQGNDRITSLAARPTGVVATGTAWNGYDFDVMTILYETDGTTRWQRQYASTGSYPETGRYVKFDPSGNVVLAASTSNQLDFDIYLAKYAAADGSILWERTYNGAFDDEPMGLALGAEGDIYLTGYTWTLAGSNDFYTARYNGTSGNLVWQQIYNSGYDNSDLATATGIAVDDSPNGDLYVTGYMVYSGNYDFLTIKYKKENGHLLWQRSFNGPADLGDRTVAIGLAPNNGVYVVGWTDATMPISAEIAIATGGSTGSAENGGKAWSTNQWAHYHIMMTGGPNAGVERKIVSNSGTTLTVSPDFGSPVSSGDSYYLFDKDNYDIHVISYDRGDLNPPTNLVSETVSKAGDGTYTIRLTWEDNSPDETGFILERKAGEMGVWGEIARPAANVTTSDDPNLSANEYYYYRVKSYRDADESYPSNEAHSLTFLVTYLAPIWQNTYNGGQNMEDYAIAIAAGPDDHPVITGRSDSGLLGMFDFYTLKLNRANGGVIWEDRYDSMQNEMDNAVCLAVDNNNDIVVSGFSSLYYAPSGGNVHSVFTMKYPSAGPPVVWEMQYNGPAGIDDRSTAIASATDGSNVHVTGYGLNSNGNNDIYLVKYLADGTQAWAITPIDGGRHDYPSGVALDPQGNVLIAGYRQGSRGVVTDLDNFDFYVAKFNASGEKLWEDSYNPYGTGDARAQGVAVDPAGDVYVAGYVTNGAGNRDFHTVKYHGSTGARVWARDYDGPAHGNDWVVGVRVDPITGKNPLDGNIVVVGTRTTESSDNDTDIHLIRYSTDGELRWEKTLLRSHLTDTAEAIAMDGSGYIYIAGDTGSDLDRDLLAVIYDYEGALLGGTTFNGGNGYDQASSIAVNHQGEAFVAGYTTNSSQNADYLVIKQKNNYMLVPTPFVASPQADYSRIALSWRENSPGTRFRIEKTLGPVTTNSTWDLLIDLPSGTTTHTDTGLTSGTEYCYRIEAYQGTLPSRKVVACGTTTLPAPAWNATSGITTTALTINWHNQAGNTGYKVERKVGAGPWENAPNGLLTANSVSFTDSGLSTGTAYTYRVSARNAGGYSLPSAELAVWTLPAAPILNAPTVDWATRVDLAWTNVTGETGYRIERKTGAAGTWSTVATKGVDLLTHSDTTTTAATQYYYRIVALNASGETVGNEAAALTKGAPVVLASADNSSAAGRIDLTWNDLPDETGYILQESVCTMGVSGYDPAAYCRDYFSSGTYYWSAWGNVASIGQNVTSHSRTGLTAGAMYRYRIVATLPGNATEPSNLKGGWPWLASPNPLSVTPASETSLALSWTNISGESRFEVWRKQGQAGTYAKVTDTALNASSYTDSNLLQQTEYCYQVKGVNTAGNVDAVTPPETVTDEICLPTPLPAPVLNTPTVVSSSQVDLSWSAVDGSTGYEIEKCRYYDPNLPQSGQTNISQPPNSVYWVGCTSIPKETGVTTHSDTELAAGNTYRYRIRDSYGTSPVYTSGWSSYAVVTTIPPAPVMFNPTTGGSTQLTPSWADVAGEMEYRLEWKVMSGADCTDGAWNSSIPVGQNITSYAHANLSASTWYCYRVKAVNGAMMSTSAPISQTTATVAPELTSLEVLSTTSIKVSWNAIAGATNYRISRKIFPSGIYAVVATIPSTQTDYTDSSLSAGTLYGYQVEAQNTGGFSSYSNELTATTKPSPPMLTAISVANNQADLSWPAVKGATNYKVERRPAGGAMGEIQNLTVPYAETYCGYPVPRIGCQTLSPNTAAYSDTGIGVSDTYCYQVKAWNATGGDSAASNEVCVATGELAAPVLSATAMNSLHVGLAWSYSPGSCAAGPCESPTGFALEKQLFGGQWQKIKLVDATTLNYTDISGIGPDRSYSYRILAYAGVLDQFANGISASTWSQQGILRDGSGAIVTNTTTPPIAIADAANGTIRITPGGGEVQMTTSSPGNGLADSFNVGRITLLDPSSLHGNFDVQVDYRLPEIPVTPGQYHVYGRLNVGFPNGAGANHAYVERSTGAYVASITVNDLQTSASLPTTDTLGKLRLVRNNDRMSAYAWIGGKWRLLTETPGASTAAANTVQFAQYAQRNESVSLKIIVDNFEATSNKSGYSPTATATTPPYSTADGNCP